ncbi:hypothetical protein [Kutzneria kofuensis]|uniref:NADPH:quinone reductase-like Zn-dependent oxidoreductase n=1 Tax=Kutzneria kofuensis TaxID=103725 RepID=A0A7W9NK66_9PSEU|nr:hypothetical protein [Kutzneria kofuensis]MBB5895056.1 NADPH:quinone reductase-like Zn-dependent oxidoreductase [Kutzneria kofuensis]
MKLAGKTALVAESGSAAAVATVLRRAGARVETTDDIEAALAEAAARFGGLDIVFAPAHAHTVHAALPHLRDNGAVILYGRASAHPPTGLLEPRWLRVNYVTADASTPPDEVAEAVLFLASDDAFTVQGEELVLNGLALAS